MTDLNSYNFQDFTQGQTIDLGTNQIFSQTQSSPQIIQENTQIDPSTYLQGDTAILQASAGLENTTNENIDYNFQPTSYDTNAIFGENIQGTTTTTTNNITTEVNNYFGDTNALVSNNTGTNEIQGTNIDLNSYFNSLNNNDNNTDTNALYFQNQPTTTTTTTTTDYNNLFTQPQEENIQGTTTYGETQIISGTDANNYFTTSQPVETTQTNTNEFISYQTTGTTDLNNYGFGTTDNTTTTTNTYVENYNPQVQGTYDISAQPITETQYIPAQGQFNISQFNQNNFENIPMATSTLVNQPQIQTTQTTTTTTYTTTQAQNQVQSGQNLNVITQPQIQTQIQTQPQIQTQIQTQPQIQTQIQTQPQIQTQVQTQPQIQTQTQPQIQTQVQTQIQTQPLVQTQVQPKIQNQIQNQPQIIPLQNNNIQRDSNTPLGFPFFGRIIDEDFRRGRPIYTDIGQLGKIKANNPQNVIYRVRNIPNHDNIGLSRLTPAISYDRSVLNNASINPNITNNLNNQINMINNNVNNLGNAINNFGKNMNTGMEKMARASSYNVGAQSITPLLNNVGLNKNN